MTSTRLSIPRRSPPVRAINQQKDWHQAVKKRPQPPLDSFAPPGPPPANSAENDGAGRIFIIKYVAHLRNARSRNNNNPGDARPSTPSALRECLHVFAVAPFERCPAVVVSRNGSFCRFVVLRWSWIIFIFVFYLITDYSTKMASSFTLVPI